MESTKSKSYYIIKLLKYKLCFFFLFVFWQKKRKLKKIVKRKKWMLKNCKEELEEDEPIDDELCFLTMVDLKLVSRMLNMKKITRKQLSWCHHKLSCITFPNGNIKIHPSSFLFSSS